MLRPDGIAAEMYHCGGDTLTSCMHQLCIELWGLGELPQDLKDALIMTIYKNKGDRRDCSNCCGISLLSVAGKCLAKIILGFLVSNITDNILPGGQCSFWLGHGAVGMVFSLGQL